MNKTPRTALLSLSLHLGYGAAPSPVSVRRQRDGETARDRSDEDAIATRLVAIDRFREPDGSLRSEQRSRAMWIDRFRSASGARSGGIRRVVRRPAGSGGHEEEWERARCRSNDNNYTTRRSPPRIRPDRFFDPASGGMSSGVRRETTLERQRRVGARGEGNGGRGAVSGRPAARPAGAPSGDEIGDKSGLYFS